MNKNKYNILGIGNAIVDIIVKNIDEEFLALHDFQRGSMHLIDSCSSSKILSNLQDKRKVFERVTSGGSCANTLVALAQIGIKTNFIGNVGDDHFGGVFIRDLKDNNVDYSGIICNNGDTANCIVMVSADGERTMLTNLNMAGLIDSSFITKNIIESADLLYVEGYLWHTEQTRSAVKNAIGFVKGARQKVALSLSDSFCVKQHREDFMNMVINDCDIVFGNESEIIALTQENDLVDALHKLSKTVYDIENKTILVTLGSGGAVALHQNVVTHSKPQSVINPIDTTGAGDSFAAGFLYGYINNFPINKSLEFGNAIALSCIQIFGGRLEKEELLTSIKGVN